MMRCKERKDYIKYYHPDTGMAYLGGMPYLYRKEMNAFIFMQFFFYLHPIIAVIIYLTKNSSHVVETPFPA